MEKKFINIKEDVSDGSTASSHADKIFWVVADLRFSFKIKEVKDRKKSFIFINCLLQSSKDWGLQKISIDGGSRVDVLSYRSLKSSYASNEGYEFYDQGYIEITKSELKRVCAAENIKLRINGEARYTEPDDAWNAKFHEYLRQFYNNVFDSEAYADSVAKEPASVIKATGADARAERAAKLQSYTDLRDICVVVFLFLLVITVILAVKRFEVAAYLVGFCSLASLALLFMNGSVVSEILKEISSECPSCYQKAIKFCGDDQQMLAVRSEERVVWDEVQKKHKSTQVTVTDSKVTNKYKCMSCGHAWSSSYIKTVG